MLVCVACAPPPQGRPIYTPIPESLQPQTVAPARAEPNEQVELEVRISSGDTLLLEPKIATLVDSESTVELRDEQGRTHEITVRVGAAAPKTGSHPVKVTYVRDGELLIEGARHPLPGQVVAFDGPEALSMELVIVNRSGHQ